MPENGRLRGRVKWFDEAKGYGFIERDGAPDVFVHYTGIVGEGFRTLPEGAEVEYTLVDTPRGPRAEGVVVLQ
ncbi:MAG: cold shock domain-containing protein [Armatimonadetes bacterium]|nr:cold shock domain-containing protein [Armatimonadota bacterium]